MVFDNVFLGARVLLVFLSVLDCLTFSKKKDFFPAVVTTFIVFLAVVVALSFSSRSASAMVILDSDFFSGTTYMFITFETDGISGQNHESADQFLKIMEELCGTQRITKKKPKAFNHHHHNHSHKAGI